MRFRTYAMIQLENLFNSQKLYSFIESLAAFQIASEKSVQIILQTSVSNDRYTTISRDRQCMANAGKFFLTSFNKVAEHGRACRIFSRKGAHTIFEWCHRVLPWNVPYPRGRCLSHTKEEGNVHTKQTMGIEVSTRTSVENAVYQVVKVLTRYVLVVYI